jgi:CDP-glycerol glycerophosphotransferase
VSPVPRITVVVPIYNVEAYLDECLESLAGQTLRDLEVVMVDDGSTDASAEIAERFAERDGRFRLIRQANGGLSAARNTGIDAAGGELLAFVDSDDALPLNAYELLLGALDKTGSDFATGNVHRLKSQVQFLSRAFGTTRLKTHITRFRPLLADRTAWNKLWRRSFWDAHELRFPEGRVHEDIPVVLPAHFMARSVDVLADPVYYYRVRESGDLSITQRRLERRVLADRLSAVEEVHAYLEREGPRRARHWYEETIVADDLRYFLDVLDRADDEYRQLFLDRANALLDRCSSRIYRPLPPIQRLKWHLARRRALPELVEVLRFQREELAETAPVRIRGRWYGDYPFRDDRRLRIPSSVYVFRLGQGFPLEAGIDRLRIEGTRLHVEGWAYIDAIGAPGKGSQRVTLSAVARGRLRRVRARLTPIRARGRPRHRPDVTAAARRPLGDPSWSGFAASLDLRRLRARHDGTWELDVIVRAGRVTRRRMRFQLGGAVPVRAVDAPLSVRVVPTDGKELLVERRARWAVVDSHRCDGDALELSGRLRGVGASELELRPGDGSDSRRYPLAGDFTVHVPLADLLDSPDRTWQPLVDGVRLRLPEDALQAAWGRDGREVALVRTPRGEAELDVRRARPVLTGARWDGEALRLEGVPDDVALVSPDRGERHPARTPSRIPSLAGDLPLAEGTWELRAGDVPVMVSPALALPVETVIDHKRFTLGMTADGAATLTVTRDLDEDERGRFNELRLRRSQYARRRRETVRDAVVYSSFRGRQCSDSPRAIHEELVRRDAPLEHLWIVRDARARVPETATALREGSREYYAALARARYVVFNDHFPDWFRRRDDQVCVQTGHGAPLRKLGFDSGSRQRTFRRVEHRWDEQVANWQYVVSPSSFATPILRRAYGIDGEILQTGQPRVDRLLAANGVRERLGVPADARVVLYAPSYRDEVVDRRGRFRLDWRLDAERLRAALGPDTVLLARKHPQVLDAIPADGHVRDVSAYPDATELLAAADVLVTDYSSLMADFANTGRPILLYAYDLEDQQARGFYLDLATEAPGPLLRSPDELLEALRDVDAAVDGCEERYRAFAARFCELDDGRAAGRVVDRVLTPIR